MDLLKQQNIAFQLEYPPSINHYYVRTKKGMAINKAGKLYRQIVKLQLRLLAGAFTPDQRIAIVINVFPPDNRKRDLDNILKCCLDSIQHAKVYKDDNQIDMLTVIRREPIKNGKLSIRLTECS